MRRAPVLLLLAACADLPAVEADVCGNRVLDTREDCDGQVDPSLGDGLRCGDECRYVCNRDARCPTGWSCGDDQVCRPHAGRFVAGEPVRLPTASLELADFDGDGRLDLFGDDGFRYGVAYGTSSGELLPPGRLANRFGSGLLAIDDVDGDGRQDVLLVDDGHLALWMGDASRELQPTIHPQRAVAERAGLAVVAVPIGGPRDAVVEIESDEHFTVVRADGVEVASLFPGGPLVGPPAVGDLDRRLAGDELVLAVGSQAHVIGRDATGAWGVMASVDAGAPIRHGVAVAELDGDGDLDLLISVPGTTIFGDRLAVALGDGEGGFSAAAIDPRLDALYGSVAPGGRSPRRLPLAAGPLRAGDPRDALVSAGGVFVWQGDELVRIDDLGLVFLSGAAIADFNRDGQADVAVSEADATGVYLLLGAPWGLSPILIGTAGVATRLLAADLDGDLVEDLVFAEAGFEPGGRQRLALMSGTVQGPLAPEVSLGEVDAIVGLAAGQVSFGAGLDLLLVSQRAGAPADTHELAVLEDGPDRRLRSPLRLRDDFLVPGGIGLGDLLGDDAHPDLAVWSAAGLSVLPGRGDGTFDRDGQQDLALPEEVLGFCLELVVGDFTAARGDEILVFSGIDGCETPGPGAPASQLVLVERGQTPRLLPVSFAGRTPVEWRVVDLDSDGRDELVVRCGWPDGTVEVLREAATLEAIRFPAGTGALAALNLDAGPDLELLGVGDSGTFQARHGDPGWTIGESSFDLAARLLRAGDLDGDGLTDLVVVEPGGLAVIPYLGEAR